MILLFRRNVKSPVLAINRAMEKITLGDLTTPVPDLGENEIGGIAKGVAFLEERLSLIIGKLNSTAVNVSMAIKQVDYAHQNVIEGITNQSGAVKDISRSIQNARKSQAERR
jgi:methyl-accepting chemotaxis protein